MFKNPLGVVDRGLSHDILVIGSFTSLSWGTPVKVMDSPLSTTSSGFLHTNQYNVGKHFRASDSRHSWFVMRVGLECGFILKETFPNLNTISNPLDPLKLFDSTFLLVFLLIKGTYYVASILNIRKCA